MKSKQIKLSTAKCEICGQETFVMPLRKGDQRLVCGTCALGSMQNPLLRVKPKNAQGGTDE